MSEWYYARGGQQSGPVSFENLRELARSGGLDPAKDLVWNTGMKDWTPSGQVDGLFSSSQSIAMPAADPSNPYAAPQSSPVEIAPAAGSLPEIEPGSVPLEPTECIRRGFELTKRNFGMILLVGLVYMGILMGSSIVTSVFQGVAGPPQVPAEGGTGEVSGPVLTVFFVLQLLSQILSIYLGLGLTRIALNFVSGKTVAVGQLFGEGHKLLRALGASILFGIVVAIGFLLLIVPGVYLALRYGLYMTAIVDRDLGVMESFAYSSRLTTNNRMNLFLLGLLGFLIILAGMLACFVGLIFAAPVVWLASSVAYRWLQYGRRAIEDHPGTTTPVLSQL